MTTVLNSVHFLSLGNVGSGIPKFSLGSSCVCIVTCQDNRRNLGFCNTQSELIAFTSKHKPGHARLSQPIYASGSGLEASVADAEGSLIRLKTAKIVVESQEDSKMQVRVDLTGDDTQEVFDRVLTNLARSAPPVPGFRRQKGGKTSQVPKSFMLDILGKERVTKFVIQEIISSAMADYVKKENLTVKENKINTTQTADELKLLFTPGKEFGFNAILELEESETATPS